MRVLVLGFKSTDRWGSKKQGRPVGGVGVSLEDQGHHTWAGGEGLHVFRQGSQRQSLFEEILQYTYSLNTY